MDVSFLTPESRRRKESAIRALLKLLNDDSEFISLGGGLPNPSLFPIAGMSLRLKDGTVIEIAEDDVQRSLQYSQTPCVTKFACILDARLALYLCGALTDA